MGIIYRVVESEPEDRYLFLRRPESPCRFHYQSIKTRSCADRRDDGDVTDIDARLLEDPGSPRTGEYQCHHYKNKTDHITEKMFCRHDIPSRPSKQNVCSY